MKTYQNTKLTLLLFVAATMFTFASCSKDDSASDTPTNAPASVADTEWEWRDNNYTSGVIDVEVGFNGPKLADLIYTDMSTGIMQTDVLIGTYDYSNGKGTLTLNDETNNTTVNLSFTVSGTSMTLSFRGITYTLTPKQ
ncbi:MAG: hypothetical protein IKP21_04900 [Bacteroidales bacterium]|nr:hypothetical protein [Bacteroidales bacterium]